MGKCACYRVAVIKYNKNKENGIGLNSIRAVLQEPDLESFSVGRRVCGNLGWKIPFCVPSDPMHRTCRKSVDLAAASSVREAGRKPVSSHA